jgi:hypothetical protein
MNADTAQTFVFSRERALRPICRSNASIQRMHASNIIYACVKIAGLVQDPTRSRGAVECHHQYVALLILDYLPC